MIIKTQDREFDIISHEVQDNETAILMTKQSGAVLVSKRDTPEVWQAMIDGGLDMTVSQSFLTNKVKQDKLMEIQTLENSITPRLMREALNNGTYAKNKIAEIEKAITLIRGTL